MARRTKGGREGLGLIELAVNEKHFSAAPHRGLGIYAQFLRIGMRTVTVENGDFRTKVDVVPQNSQLRQALDDPAPQCVRPLKAHDENRVAGVVRSAS